MIQDKPGAILVALVFIITIVTLVFGLYVIPNI